MKLAFAGKGGAGKTTLAAWTADYLARHGHDVWMIDADTALSLGRASGLARDGLPVPLVERHDLIMQRIGTGMISLTPEVGDLPEALAVDVPLGGSPTPGVAPGRKRLLVMGSVAGAGGGCACEANALLKALLAHLVHDRREWVLVDLEAGVEHLGRGTVAAVDGLAVVSEPGLRSLETAADIARLAHGLGLHRQVLALNRLAGPCVACAEDEYLPQLPKLPDSPELGGLPAARVGAPALPGLAARMLDNACVTGLPEHALVDRFIGRLLEGFGDAAWATA
ncbi:CO dehydrogenase/acetyl-CoA synthase complex, accessory protein CooC [Desulfovibrio sp. A2]|nr:CO dehydrogenase/acetyl-CoA synthase complex, accessory protein CooC [Desulfovibrio sp. A2]